MHSRPPEKNSLRNPPVTRQMLQPAAMVVQASKSASTAAGPASVPGTSGDRDAAQSPDTAESTAPTDKPTPDDAHVQRGAGDTR